MSPTRGRSTTVFRFRFRAPDASGRQGDLDHLYTLTVIGRPRSGCVFSRERPVPSLAAGQAASVAVGPAQLGGVWCRGTYAAQVTEEERPVCAAGQMCPQFIRIAAVFGPVRFTVGG